MDTDISMTMVSFVLGPYVDHFKSSTCNILPPLLGTMISTTDNFFFPGLKCISMLKVLTFFFV